MGTMLQIVARGPVARTVETAVDAALRAVELVDRLMSFHAPGSELSRINREALAAPQSVHPWTYAVLRRARRISEVSAGLFDVTVAPAMVRAGWLPDAGGPLPVGGNWRAVELLPAQRVRFSQPVSLDLGGIAKGFAVDMAILALRRGGCTDATVNAGGDLRRYGRTHEVVHMRHPTGLVPVAELRSGAIATSASWPADPDRLQQPIGCILHPDTEAPWRGGSVMVAARTCMMADALTKVAALAGPGSATMLARFGAQARWEPTAPNQGL